MGNYFKLFNVFIKCSIRAFSIWLKVYALKIIIFAKKDVFLFLLNKATPFETT